MVSVFRKHMGGDQEKTNNQGQLAQCAINAINGTKTPLNAMIMVMLICMTRAELNM